MVSLVSRNGVGIMRGLTYLATPHELWADSGMQSVIGCGLPEQVYGDGVHIEDTDHILCQSSVAN